MATTQEQSANGLSPIPLPEIPVKLRCTICSELARGASRLPCCEQSICESCHKNLPNVCPVCDHSPLSPDDCKPNTALRTTVAVFLRTAEKKHNLLQQKEQKEKIKPTEPKVEAKTTEPESDKITPAQISPVQNPLTPPQEVDDSVQSEGQQALLQASPENMEAVERVSAKAHDATPAPEIEQTNGFADQQNAWFNQQNPNQIGNMQQMQQMFPSHDFSGPNGWNVYNQVMQEMQGGWMNGYGNMMEYPMNSAVVQGGGFGGGNFGNMGMNGAGGFHNGHDGMGWGAGWNGQNNVGFNPGMEGTRNGGYYSTTSAGGYNHQSHGNLQMPTQQYQNHHFQRQPYPRGGRGGFAGGARQYSHERQQQAFQESQFSQQLQGIDEAFAAVAGSSGDEKKGEKIASVVSGNPENIADPNDVPTDTASTVLAGTDPVTEDLADSHNLPAPMNPDMTQYFSPDDFRGPGYQPPFYPPRGGFRGNFRGGYRGDFGMGPKGGGVHNVAPIPVLGDPDSDKMQLVGLGVEGAPTGPKALREAPIRGVSIRGGVFGRGRGVYAGSSWTRSISPTRARVYSRSRSRRRSSATGRDRSRDPSHDRRRKSRSRSRDRSRQHKQRSPSVGSDCEHRGRTPERDGEEQISPVQDKELTNIVTSQLKDADIAQSNSAIRSKRSREDSGSRERVRSASRSRSRSMDRHHKRSRRDRDRRAGPTTESRDREGKDKDSKDKDGSSRHHRRSHKRKSSRRHRSRSRSRSPKKDDYLIEDKTTIRDIDGTDGRTRRDSRERERRHKRRSKREESRHRSHRHKSSRHDRHDRHEKEDKYDKDEKHDRDDKQDRKDDRKDRHEKGELDAIIEKKVEGHRHVEKDPDRKSVRDSRSRRKLSYKYEDEEDLERRAERDREAERWGGIKK